MKIDLDKIHYWVYERDEISIFLIVTNAGFCLVSFYHEEYNWAWIQGAVAVFLTFAWGLTKALNYLNKKNK